MKKLITLSVICLITSVLLSSCKSGVSITKRHYTKGYYVSHNKGKKSLPSLRSEEKINPVKPMEVVATVNVPAEQNVQTTSLSQNKGYANNNVTVANTQKKQNKTVSKRSDKEVMAEQEINVNNSEGSQISHRSLSSEKISAGSGDDDALSLLWIVILVILILWVLGFLAGGFGLGGFINILLIIALILLILWLLRIL